MSKFILRRLLQLIPTVIGISIVVFLLLRLIPGDICRRLHGVKVSPEVIQQCRADLFLDKPVWFQYGKYVEKMLNGDFGESYLYRRPALELIQQRASVTLLLAFLSICFSVIISIPLGIISTLKKDSWLDHSIRGVSTATLAMPSFVIALLLMLIFSIRLDLFPISGYGDTFWEHIHHLILPAFTLAIAVSALLSRNLRASLLEVLGSDFIRASRSKGLTQRLVFINHAIPNVMVTYISLLALNLVYIIGSTVIVEQVFTMPGLGTLMITSIYNRDYEIVQSLTLIFAILVEIVNLGTDMIFPFIDPRIKYG
jgi:peptide/nickel transport system permease protein